MATRKTHILSGFVLFLMNTITLENIKFPILPKFRRVAAGLGFDPTSETDITYVGISVDDNCKLK